MEANKIIIFELGGCCSTSLMNQSHYSDLKQLDTYTKDLQKQGVTLLRINAALKPDLLSQVPGIEDFLNDKGIDIFPITIVNDTIVKTKDYPNLSELTQWSGIEVNH